jgi:hypothetical protein
VPLTSHVTYNMSDGKTCDTVESAVVRLDTDTGTVRLGRGLPDPALPAGLCTRRCTCHRGDGAGALGADPVGPEALMDKLDAWLPGP